MNKDGIIKEIKPIFLDVLDMEEIDLNENTTAADVEEWDSLNHIQLVVAIEKYFHIKFTSLEIQKWVNVGDMCETIISKQIK
jgi:acyl carrier protein